MKTEIPKSALKKITILIKNYKVPLDLIDVNAIYDNKITQEENLSGIEKTIKNLSSSNDFEHKINVEGKEKGRKAHEKQEAERILLENLRKEEKNTEKQFNKSFKELKNSNSDFINKTFDIPINFIKSVIRDYNTSFIFLGHQGLGKSTITLQTLLKENADFVYQQGFLTPLKLYKFLYEHRENKIICFDDVAGLVSNTYSLSLILSALWSATDKRKVSWNSTTGKLDIPTEFIFNSRIIFIANKIPNTEYAELVMSRCLNYEINLNYQELLMMMIEIAKMPHKKLEQKQRLEIVDFIKENTDETTKNFDLRIQKKIENLFLYDKERWRDFSLAILNKKDSKLALVKKLLLTATYIKDAVEQYCKITGDSRRNFYYLKNKLSAKVQ